MDIDRNIPFEHSYKSKGRYENDTKILKEDYPRLYKACAETSKNVDKDKFDLSDTREIINIENHYTVYRTKEEKYEEFKSSQIKLIKTLSTASKNLADEFVELSDIADQYEKEKDYTNYKKIQHQMESTYSSMAEIGGILSIIKTDEGYKTFSKYIFENRVRDNN